MARQGSEMVGYQSWAFGMGMIDPNYRGLTRGLGNESIPHCSYPFGVLLRVRQFRILTMPLHRARRILMAYAIRSLSAPTI